MKRIPLVPTLVVGLAILAMIALGVWQLTDRLPAKEAYLAQLADNPARPVMAWPRVPADTMLFRRASAFCLEPVEIKRAGAGAAGFRLIATCRTGAEGPGLRVQIGTTRDPEVKVAWPGGEVSGWIAHAPDARPLIAGLFSKARPEFLLVADRPAPGLNPNARPDISSVPNNHLAYGVQWCLFAAVAAIVYAFALRRRARDTPAD